MENNGKYLRQRRQGEDGPTEKGSGGMSLPVWPGRGVPARKCGRGGPTDRAWNTPLSRMEELLRSRSFVTQNQNISFKKKF